MEETDGHSKLSFLKTGTNLGKTFVEMALIK